VSHSPQEKDELCRACAMSMEQMESAVSETVGGAPAAVSLRPKCPPISGRTSAGWVGRSVGTPESALALLRHLQQVSLQRPDPPPRMLAIESLDLGTVAHSEVCGAEPRATRVR